MFYTLFINLRSNNRLKTDMSRLNQSAVVFLGQLLSAILGADELGCRQMQTG